MKVQRPMSPKSFKMIIDRRIKDRNEKHNNKPITDKKEVQAQSDDLFLRYELLRFIKSQKGS